MRSTDTDTGGHLTHLTLPGLLITHLSPTCVLTSDPGVKQLSGEQGGWRHKYILYIVQRLGSRYYKCVFLASDCWGKNFDDQSWQIFLTNSSVWMNWYFCVYFVLHGQWKFAILLFFRINKDINIISNPGCIINLVSRQPQQLLVKWPNKCELWTLPRLHLIDQGIKEVWGSRENTLVMHFMAVDMTHCSCKLRG